jgi:hypothetical protein
MGLHLSRFVSCRTVAEHCRLPHFEHRNRLIKFSSLASHPAIAAKVFGYARRVVSELMERRVFRSDDVAETAPSIWAHAHGLISLYLSGRIRGTARGVSEVLHAFVGSLGAWGGHKRFQ